MIFGPKKGITVLATNLLQRYAIFLVGYNYKIQYIKGVDNEIADALSRLSLNTLNNFNNSVMDNYFLNLITENIKSISNVDICEKIKKDSLSKEVFISVFTEKWQKDYKNIAEEMKPYYNCRDQFTIEQGCKLWNCRLIILLKFRAELLAELHSTHMGIIKMKRVWLDHTYGGRESGN